MARVTRPVDQCLSGSSQCQSLVFSRRMKNQEPRIEFRYSARLSFSQVEHMTFCDFEIFSK